MRATEWDERYRTTELVWTAEPNRFVVQECALLDPGKALDLAAGEGRNSVWLASRGWQVDAVDFSQIGLEKGRELAEEAAVGGRIEWICADIRDWTPPDHSYDLVVVAYLHLPAEDLSTVLAHAADGLAPGGKLVVVGHDRANLDAGVGGPQDPAVLYQRDAIRTALSHAGLSGIRADTVERPTPNGIALDTLVTATRDTGDTRMP